MESDDEVTFKTNDVNTENDNFEDNDTKATGQTSNVVSNSSETQIESALAKQMYVLNSDIQKSMQVMKGQVLQVFNELTEKVCTIEKKLENKQLGGTDSDGKCPHTETNPIQSLGWGPSRGKALSSSSNENENAHNTNFSREVNRNELTNGGLKIKPQIYDGTDDFEEYLAQFQIMAELNGWNYNVKSLALASSLSGRARTLLAELDENKCRDFNALVSALRNRYGSENRSELFKAELQGKVRGRNETIPELVESIKKLTRRAYRNVTPDVADTLAIDYFIDAIPESEIRLRLKELGPKTMTEAENIAVKLETLRVADKQRGKPVRSLEQNSQNNENVVETRIKQLEQTVSNMSKNARYNKNDRGQTSNVRNGQYGNRQNFNQRRGYNNNFDQNRQGRQNNDGRQGNY